MSPPYDVISPEEQTELLEGSPYNFTHIDFAKDLPNDDPQKPVVVNYAAEYTKKTGQGVSNFGGYAYDAFAILTEALKRASKLDGPTVRDQIEQTKNLVGITGIFNMSPTNHVGLKFSSFRMVEIKNHGWSLVK